MQIDQFIMKTLTVPMIFQYTLYLLFGFHLEFASTKNTTKNYQISNY